MPTKVGQSWEDKTADFIYSKNYLYFQVESYGQFEKTILEKPTFVNDIGKELQKFPNL